LLRKNLSPPNFFFEPDEPLIFDCIEFDDRFRKIDVLNEISFLCVDLEFFRKDELSNIFYREYLKAFGTSLSEKMDRLFYYYKSYRANIRAKVTLIRAMNSEDQDDRPLEDAKKYLKLMKNYTREFQ